MADVLKIHELRRYWDIDQISPAPPQCSHALGFDPSLADASPLCAALDALADVTHSRLQTFGLFISLTDGFRQRLIAGTWNNNGHNGDDDAPHWLAPEDADKEKWLWLGRQTLSLDRSPPGTAVVRLHENEHTANLGCVKTYPNLAYYAAAPIVTSQQVAIGNVFLVDVVDRSHSESRDLDYLLKTARKCMAQLESSRAAYLRERVTRVSRSLNSFVLSRKITARLHEEPPVLNRKPGHTSSSSSDTETRPNPELDETAADFVRSELQRDGDGKTPGSGEQESRSNVRGETTYRQTFAKAADVLRHGLGVDGVVFVDGIVGFRSVLMPVAEPEIELENELFQRPELRRKSNHDSPDQHRRSPPQQGDALSTPPPNIGPRGQRDFSSNDYKKSMLPEHPAEALGIAIADSKGPHLVNISPSTVGLKSLDESFLQTLLDRFPHGKIWYYEPDGTPYIFTPDDKLINVDDDEDAHRIAASFPGVRQLFFAPLTDPASLKRLAGCIAWTTRVTPAFTESTDLSIFMNFLLSVESEISRIDAIAAVKQQESFVSSVSHELRTPLHGILGAVEFLSETSLDDFQQGLADTIRLCGSTLHDTLSSVLSYAKINQFTRRRNKPLQRASKDLPWAMEDKDTSRPVEGADISCSADIAALCEEVVEVSASGYACNKSASSAAEDLSVVLDISYRDNWNFLTEPGALRRILTNILGNALKYTDRGFVRVSLQVEEVEHEPARKLVQITVTDSGRGMSNDFLQTHLFLPFTQEDTVASEGVGLGMSIVKSLVALLGGKIHVNSQPGEGSSFIVSIPMEEDKNPEPTSSSSAALSEVVQQVRQQPRTVAFCGFDEMMRHSLANYFNQWFQWEVLYIDGSFNACTDVLIIDQTDDDAREKARICLDEGSFVMLTLLAMPSLSLCKSLPADGLKNQVAMARPVGPLKLAKAVVACTDFLTGIKKAEDVPVEALMAQDDLGKKGVESAQSKKTQRVPQDRREDRSVAERTRTTVQIAKPKGLVVPAQSEALQTERTPRLLLVEDNQVNLKLLKTFMAKQGCKNIRTAENGQIAVEEVMRLAEASRAFDIIFMDISMPVMDGFAATVAIRNIEREKRGAGKPPLKDVCPSSYIVALAGLASARDEERGYQSGMDLVLTKPVKFKELKELLQRWKAGKELKNDTK